MPKILMEVVFPAQRSNFGRTNVFFILNYFIVKSHLRLLNRLILQKKAIIFRKVRPFSALVGWLHKNVAKLAFEVSNYFKVERASSTVVFNG